MAAHARLSPSSADRWMVCTGSVKLIERLIAAGMINPNSSSGAADEGSAAHQIRADALDLGLDAFDFEDSVVTIGGVEYVCDSEMARHLQVGIDWIREQPGDVLVEYRVDLSRWLPDQFGTLDTAIIQVVNRTLIINDLKYGAGVPVDPDFNRQLRIYALGVWDNIARHVGEIDTIVIVIDQPRAGGLKFWEVSLEDLLEFGEEVRAAGLAVEDPDAPLVATEKGCKWCPVRNTDVGCPAYNKWMSELFANAFDDINDGVFFPDADMMTPEKRWHIVQHAHLATRWLADLHMTSLRLALGGDPDPGSKAVYGQKGNRYYTDEDAAEFILTTALGDEAWIRKLLSPAQAEKVLAPGRKKVGQPKILAALNALVDQDDGKPILVPEEDPRPPVAKLAEEFDDL